MSNHATVKLAALLIEAARQEATMFNRSLSGQIEHWAQLGRAVERAPGFNHQRVREALDGLRDPDDLTLAEQEAFFDAFGESLRKPDPKEDAFFAERRASGAGVGELEDGSMARQLPGGRVERY